MAGAATLICPKCRGEMRTYERNGVQVDQCEDCRGVFLDRGELEQLLEAGAASANATPPRDAEREHSHEHDGGSHRRKRTSASSLISDFLGGGE